MRCDTYHVLTFVFGSILAFMPGAEPFAATARGDDCFIDPDTPSADCDHNGLDDDCELSGDAPFTTVRNVAVGPFPHVLAAADIDGDGDVDVISSDRAGDTLSILSNDGHGRMTLTAQLPVADEPRGIAVGDVDGDGDLDVVSGNGNEDNEGAPPTNSVLLHEDGAFARRLDFPANTTHAGALRSTHLADMDGDGDLDLINGFSDGHPGGILTMLENHEDGEFGAPRRFDAGTPGFESLRWAQYVAVDDVDGDALPDIITLSGQVLFNRGSFDLAPPRDFAVISDARVVKLADIDDDENLDVLIARNVVGVGGTTGEVRVFLHEDDFFVEASTSPVAIGFQIQEGLAAADLDADGAVDLAVALFDAAVVVLYQREPLRFRLEHESLDLAGSIPRWLLAQDLNGDARADLVVPKNDGFVSFLFDLRGDDRNGDGILDTCERFVRSDCDGDGTIGGGVTDALFLLNHAFLDGPAPPCLAACDIDGDGRVGATLTDAVSLLTFLFLSGPPPAAPFPACGPSTLESDAVLGCERLPDACGR